jgi:hypothetical protein
MSTERMPLVGWISALVDTVALAEPAAAARLSAAVGEYRARIRLDGDVAEIALLGGRVVALPVSGDSDAADGSDGAGGVDGVDGVGASSRGAVLAILDGRLDASEAVRHGLIEARGSVAAIGRIFHAIEIILDVATRSPALRALAHQFRLEDPDALRPRVPVPDDRDQLDLLRRLGLLG